MWNADLVAGPFKGEKERGTVPPGSLSVFQDTKIGARRSRGKRFIRLLTGLPRGQCRISRDERLLCGNGKTSKISGGANLFGLHACVLHGVPIERHLPIRSTYHPREKRVTMRAEAVLIPPLCLLEKRKALRNARPQNAAPNGAQQR